MNWSGSFSRHSWETQKSQLSYVNNSNASSPSCHETALSHASGTDASSQADLVVSTASSVCLVLSSVNSPTKVPFKALRKHLGSTSTKQKLCKEIKKFCIFFELKIPFMFCLCLFWNGYGCKKCADWNFTSTFDWNWCLFCMTYKFWFWFWKTHLAVDFDCGDLRWKFVFLFLFFITIGIWKVGVVLFDKVFFIFFYFFWVKSVKFENWSLELWGLEPKLQFS